jgi:hypothetical protein
MDAAEEKTRLFLYECCRGASDFQRRAPVAGEDQLQFASIFFEYLWSEDIFNGLSLKPALIFLAEIAEIVSFAKLNSLHSFSKNL